MCICCVLDAYKLELRFCKHGVGFSGGYGGDVLILDQITRLPQLAVCCHWCSLIGCVYRKPSHSKAANIKENTIPYMKWIKAFFHMKERKCCTDILHHVSRRLTAIFWLFILNLTRHRTVECAVWQ